MVVRARCQRACTQSQFAGAGPNSLLERQADGLGLFAAPGRQRRVLLARKNGSRQIGLGLAVAGEIERDAVA